ncbi:unnamed protein product, partial [marine sediment metagenome]
LIGLNKIIESTSCNIENRTTGAVIANPST